MKDQKRNALDFAEGDGSVSFGERLDASLPESHGLGEFDKSEYFAIVYLSIVVGIRVDLDSALICQKSDHHVVLPQDGSSLRSVERECEF